VEGIRKLESGENLPFESTSTLASGAIMSAVAPDTGPMFEDAANAAGAKSTTPSADTAAVSSRLRMPL
jgi:hypothetical protein